MRTITFIVLSFFLFTSSASSTVENYLLPEGIEVLSEEELLTKIIGNTSVAGFLYKEYYVPHVGDLKGGSIKGKRLGISYNGSWSIKGPIMCWKYEDGSDYDGCYSTALIGDEIRWYDTKGKKYKSLAGKVKLKQGNPDNL